MHQKQPTLSNMHHIGASDIAIGFHKL